MSTNGRTLCYDVTKRYDAFGNVVSETGSWSGPFGCGGAYGYQTDSDSGLLLLGYRYYAPSICWFLNPDSNKTGSNWYGRKGNRIKFSPDYDTILGLLYRR